MLDVGSVAQVGRGKASLHNHRKFAMNLEGNLALNENTVCVDARENECEISKRYIPGR